jgi:hypothetical protein
MFLHCCLANASNAMWNCVFLPPMQKKPIGDHASPHMHFKHSGTMRRASPAFALHRWCSLLEVMLPVEGLNNALCSCRVAACLLLYTFTSVAAQPAKAISLNETGDTISLESIYNDRIHAIRMNITGEGTGQVSEHLTLPVLHIHAYLQNCICAC